MKSGLFLWTAMLNIALLADSIDSRFPKAEELAADLKVNANSQIQPSGKGFYTIDGKPRFLISAKLAGFSPVREMKVHTAGYPDTMKWLYETPIDFNQMNRIGLDAVSINAPMRWFIQRFNPKYPDLWKGSEYLFRDGVSLHFDMGGFTPWTYGQPASGKYAAMFESGAINSRNGMDRNHWVPFNPNHPQGKALYLLHWRSSLELAKQLGNRKVFRYELFNEPSYNDPSPYNKVLFARFLENRYGSLAELNKVWNTNHRSWKEAADFTSAASNSGLYIDWSKFMEQSFTEICRAGEALIREIHPESTGCVQSMGTQLWIPFTNVNIVEIAKFQKAVSLPTGGGFSLTAQTEANDHTIDTPSSRAGVGRLTVEATLAIADGKPVHCDETYFNRWSANSLFYQALLRKIANVTLFEWGKRGWDWKTEAEGKKIAQNLSWYILNPYAVPTEVFTKIMEGKRNIQKIEDLFLTFDRNVPAEIALLLSIPTGRASGINGLSTTDYAGNTAAALMFGHYSFNAIFEEQLSAEKLAPYKVLIAGCVANMYPQSTNTLERWVRNGGILISCLETMSHDEYGAPLSKQLFDLNVQKKQNDSFAWTFAQDKRLPGKLRGFRYRQVVQADGWENFGNALYRKSLGKGWLYYLPVRLEEYSLLAALGGILNSHKVLPQAELLRADSDELIPNVEAAASYQQGLYALLLVNHDYYPKKVRIRIPISLQSAYDSFEHRFLPMDSNGFTEVLLSAASGSCVIFGKRDSLVEKYGPAKQYSSAELQTAFKKLPTIEHKNDTLAFNVKSNLIKPLNLRAVVNRHFVDEVANDGKGGWTDQGNQNSFHGVPFGLQTFLGVPCDIIRWDMNFDKSCLVLDSTRLPEGFGAKRADNIAVQEKVNSLFFFHTSAWTKYDGKPIMHYLIHYASGRTVEIPVIPNENIADWYRSTGKMRPYVAWKNLQEHCFYSYRWQNPYPEDEVVSLSAVSESGDTIPIVLAISAERYVSQKKTSLELGKLRSWGNLKISGKNPLDVVLADSSKPWSGFRSPFHYADALPETITSLPTLKFELTGGNDMYNRYQGNVHLQIGLYGNNQFATKMRRISHKINEGQSVTVEMPLRDWNIPVEKVRELNSIAIQYVDSPTSGFSIRDLRLEWE